MKIQNEMFVEIAMYESPLVEVVQIEVEKGFIVSDPTGEVDPWA